MLKVNKLPITTKTIFNIASVSKQFTAFSILLLEQEGKLSQDDSILKYVPSIGAYAEPLTLRHFDLWLIRLEEIEICYNPNNPVTKDFYASFGFVEVGMDKENKDMLAIIKI